MSDEKDMPIQNLKAQLNFEKLLDFTLEHSKLGHTFDARLWGNRNVLEASCHIDNWVSVFSGEKTSDMLQQYPDVEQNLFAERALDPRSSGAGGGGILDKIIKKSEDLEREVFRHRLDTQREDLFFDLSVTFLGCSMEMLRSSLAKWAEKNEGGDALSWKPSLFLTGTVHDTENSVILDPFNASADFMSCLQSLGSFRDMSKLFVKMRVLWELQNQFHIHLRREGVAPSCGEAMALCILSFPAVSVHPVRMKKKEECAVDLEAGDEGQIRIYDYGYIIRASLGPQDLKLCVSFKRREDNSDVEISTCICEMQPGGVTHFDWELWRNAFYGRLEGRRRWKKIVLAIRQFSLIPSTCRISSGVQKIGGSKNAVIPQNGTGVDLLVWKGWLPHCTGICMFELATEGFILQPGPTEGASLPYPVTDRLTLKYYIPQKTWMPVGYDGARAVWLKHASLVVCDLLQAKFGSGGQRDGQSTLERADMLLALNSEMNSELALQLIQVSAVHERDFTALEKAIDILLRNERGLEAADLLEEFYSYGNHGEGETEKDVGQAYSFFRNQNNVNKVICLKRF